MMEVIKRNCVVYVSSAFAGHEHPTTATQHPRQPEAPVHDGG